MGENFVQLHSDLLAKPELLNQQTAWASCPARIPERGRFA